MQIIRRVLEALYAPEMVATSNWTDLVERLPEIMETALNGSLCPFKTYEESLIAFTRSIYALHLDGGRCPKPGIPADCGFYDPYHLYQDPQVKMITYAGMAVTYSDTEQPYPVGISSSFGMDFVEVSLDPSVDGQSLIIEFYGSQGADARFDVRLWKLMDSGASVREHRETSIRAAEGILVRATPDGRLSHIIQTIDMTMYTGLGMVITRLDARESADPIGAYSIELFPGWTSSFARHF